MRESNFNFPSQNRACVCISSALYDRRAIDAPTPSLPLVNSLTHLSYLTATSPRIREILSLDGGLERLVRILKTCTAYPSSTLPSQTLEQLKGVPLGSAKAPRRSPFGAFVDDDDEASLAAESAEEAKHLVYTYTLAFQCVVNIGVRGSELIRTRVVEAGALDVVVNVLERCLEAGERRRREKEREEEPPKFEDVVGEAVDQVAQVSRTPRTSSKGRDGDADDAAADEKDADGDVVMGGEADSAARRSRTTTSSSTASTTSDGGLQYRDEDVLLSLQLLAYLSKYPHVRSVFHSSTEDMDCDDDEDLHPHSHHDEKPCSSAASSSSGCSSASTSKASLPTRSTLSNVFSLVEAFTHRPPATDKFAPRHSPEVQYWAGVIMRNACRKDESQGGIRQCANMQCGVWEKSAREFAKCRRCRKAKYCSKSCQSRAWQEGHRYWCAKATPKDGSGREEGESGSSRRERAHGVVREREEAPRPGSAAESNDDEDEPTLPPPAGRIRPSHRQSNPAIVAAGMGLDDFDPVGVMGVGVGVGEGGLDENEVAEQMMGGGVFGERVRARDA